jgi:hypothetical protein
VSIIVSDSSVHITAQGSDGSCEVDTESLAPSPWIHDTSPCQVTKPRAPTTSGAFDDLLIVHREWSAALASALFSLGDTTGL